MYFLQIKLRVRYNAEYNPWGKA